MKTIRDWKSQLHNLDRTDRRQDWRFERDHVLGLDLPRLARLAGETADSEARAELFLQREEKLLQAYFDEPKGKNKRALLRQIAEALLADDLIPRNQFERLVNFGPRHVSFADPSRN